MPAPFQAIKHGGQIEDAAEAILKKWLPTYLAEIERQHNHEADSLPHVRSWVRMNEFEAFPEDQIPMVVLVAPGLADTPVREGSGSYRAKWALGVAVVVSASTMEATKELARLYAAAIRAAILQHQSLDGFARGVEWQDERYDDLPVEDARTLGATRLVFTVDVADVTTDKSGPANPDPLPDHHDQYPSDTIVPDREHVIQDYELEEIG